jgi:cardiolipin synthase A/B
LFSDFAINSAFPPRLTGPRGTVNCQRPSHCGAGVRMRNDITLLRAWAGALVLSLLAGCATSNQRVRYLEQIEPSSLPKLIAYRASTNLELRYDFHGRDAFAVAHWPAEQTGLADYQYRYAILAFDKQPRATRKSLARHGTRLAVRNAKQWQQLVDGVFRGLMPNEPGHGVLVMVEGQETALYRDKDGRSHVVRLDQKPVDIVIDHAFTQTDFTREAIRLVEQNASQLDPTETQLLFITDQEPAFVLIDLHERLIVFLNYPIDPDSQPSDMPGLMTLRAFNSIIIRGFIVSALKNPVTLVTRGLWHIGNSGVAAFNVGPTGDVGPLPPLYQGPGMDLAAWERRLDKLVRGRRYRGKVEFLIDGERFFPALIKSVENATRSVDFQIFIFASDEYAVTIANVLKNRSAAVRVRVLLDEMGSLVAGGATAPASIVPPGIQHPADIGIYLKTGSRVEVRSGVNPWMNSDHRKCIIIDGRQAYVGGMNIGWVYRYSWHDMMVRLTGPVVGRLEKDFGEAWAHAGLLGDFAYAWLSLFEPTHAKKNEIPDGIEIRPLRTATGRLEIYRAQLEAIKQSRKYIYLETAYFSDGAIVRELIHARQRGVDVRVILPTQNDSGIMQTANLFTANELVRHGVRVYAYPGMTHVKAAIYDGWACLGSANMEKMSLRVSQELDVAFSDPASVDQLKKDLFDPDFKRAREITEPVPMNWMDSFVKAFADEL